MPVYKIDTNQGSFNIDANRQPTPEEALAYINKQTAPADNLSDSIKRSLMLQQPTPGQELPVLGIPGGSLGVPGAINRNFGNEALRAERFASENPITSSIADVARPSLNTILGLIGSNPLTAAVLTPGAQSLSDVIEGSLGDPTSEENRALAARTFPQYLKEKTMEAGLGAASAKLADVIPSLVSSGYRKILTLGSRPESVIQGAKAANLGIDLPVGSATGAPALTAAEKFMTRSPATRGKMADIFENVEKQLDTATEQTLGGISPKLTEGQAGSRVADTVKKVHEQGLINNNLAYEAIPDTFTNPFQVFELPKQQNKALELLQEYTKGFNSDINPSVVKRFKEAAGIDGNITPEVINSLDDATKMELIDNFVPKNKVKGTIESLSPDQRKVYDLTPDKRKPEMLTQLLGPNAGVTPAESINQLVGKPLDKIINRLSPEARKNVLEAVTPGFDWETLMRTRKGINEYIYKELIPNGNFEDAKWLEKMARSLREDLGDIATSQGPNAKSAFQDADKQYQEFVKLFQENPKIVQLLNAKEATAARDIVTGKGSANFIGELKKVIGDTSPEFNIVKRKYAEDFLGGSKIDEDTLRSVFSPQELQGIKEFKETAEFVKSKIPGKVPDDLTVGNPKIISLGAGGLGYLMLGGLPGAVGAATTTHIVAPRVLSRALLSPSGRALILEGARTPTTSAKAAKIITRLTTLFGGEEAIDATKPEPQVQEDLNSFLRSRVQPRQ